MWYVKLRETRCKYRVLTSFMDLPQRVHLGPSGYPVKRTGHLLLPQLYVNPGTPVAGVAVFVNLADLFNQLFMLLTTPTCQSFKPGIIAAFGYLHHPTKHG